MKLKNHPGFKRLAVVITLASFVITYFYYFVNAGSDFEKYAFLFPISVLISLILHFFLLSMVLKK